ncbi:MULTISPECIES: acyl-CoA dehydrogenase family protein [unclassified Corynebacterium]|uniref:acyl-CoA dehydrogenase family protein n=1 Tax=unclassified Corynebacterium TaxID=2624378 RepID=UPI0029CA72D1|nr:MULTISPECIES: acyl-CoA dehydrogenase family protein [unclassified Corynebacterium]WPF66233.1 acyl-CoA dehydrogenase family protein [Corynebacterium sp. 22KM0430]WPF68723.1 acyl-CoA dehydrogenase family protein [Corynebacterium sp. 21KM1197]
MTDKNRATPEKGSPRTLPTTPDPAATKDLRKLLDGRWASSRDVFRQAVSERGKELLHDPTLSMDEAREAMLDKLAILAETKMQKGVFAPENGGGGDTGATLTGLEMVGYADLSTMVKGGVQWGLWGGAVDALGTERHSHYVRDIIDLKLLGCFGMTERGHGSDVQNIETTATYDPETKEFIVDSPTPSAEKVYIGNAAKHGRMAAVFAQLYTPGVEESHGVHCLLVPIRDEDGNTLPGVTIGDHGHKGGLMGVDNGTLSFDKVRVPREALLNRFGDVSEDGVYSSPIESRNRRFFTMLGTLIRGRVAVGAAAGAATRASLTIAVRYAMRRRQFEGLPGKEKRLIDHRAHRLRLLPRLARSYALALLQNQMIERLHDQTSAINRGEWDVANPNEEQLHKQRETESRAAAVKVAATAHATDTIQECREACGGAGYMAENRLTIFKGDSDVFTTFEGDNTVLLQLVGKELITAYARDLSDLSPLDMVKFSVESISDVLRQRTSIPLTVQSLIERVSDREENSLFDAGYQAKIIQEREQNLVKSLARRLKDAKKMEPADAVKLVDRAQDHLIDLAWARINTMLIEALIEAEAELPKDSPAFPVLEQIRHLFAFSTILKHAGWYQEQNILSGNRTKAARAAVNDLVDSIGPWSGVLVDAFGIPDVLVDVPMLNDSGVDPLPGAAA